MVWIYPMVKKFPRYFWHDPRTWQTDRQTGRRTNTQTPHDSIDHAYIASRGKNAWQHVPVYLQQFPSYSNHNCKKIAIFTYPGLHFFVCPGDAPVAITQNVTWMKRQFSACQTPCSMYPPIFNNFPVIRTASAKNRRFHVPQRTFLFPLETPLRLSHNMLHGWKDN